VTKEAKDFRTKEGGRGGGGGSERGQICGASYVNDILLELSIDQIIRLAYYSDVSIIQMAIE
jgi:hypothetical protein